MFDLQTFYLRSIFQKKNADFYKRTLSKFAEFISFPFLTYYFYITLLLKHLKDKINNLKNILRDKNTALMSLSNTAKMQYLNISVPDKN